MATIVNPATIVYAKVIPPNKSLIIEENDFYQYPIDPNSRKVTVQSPDPRLIVNNLSDNENWLFQLDYVPQVPIASSGTITPFFEEDAITNPAVKGQSVDQIDLAWTLNKAVASQGLSSDDGGIDDVVLSTSDRDYSFTGLDITTDTEFYLDLDDGNNLEGSTLQVVFRMLFGNYFYYGAYASQLGKNTSALQAILGGLNKIIVVEKGVEINPSGVANEHFFMAYPKSYGLPEAITKNELKGGWIRLKNVAGVLKGELADGDTESDISISNGLVSEAYYVFQSQFDYQVDNQNKVVIS